MGVTEAVLGKDPVTRQNRLVAGAKESGFGDSKQAHQDRMPEM